MLLLHDSCVRERIVPIGEMRKWRTHTVVSFLIVKTKYPPNKIITERLYFSSQLKKGWSLLWQRNHVNRSMVLLFTLVCSQEGASKHQVGLSYIPPRPTPSDTVPRVRLQLLNVSQLSKSAAPTRYRVFKHEPIRDRPYSNQSTQKGQYLVKATHLLSLEVGI